MGLDGQTEDATGTPMTPETFSRRLTGDIINQGVSRRPALGFELTVLCLVAAWGLGIATGWVLALMVGK